MDSQIIVAVLTFVAARYVYWVIKFNKQSVERAKLEHLQTINFLNDCLKEFHRDTDPNYDAATFVPLERRLRDAGRL